MFFITAYLYVRKQIKFYSNYEMKPKWRWQRTYWINIYKEREICMIVYMLTFLLTDKELHKYSIWTPQFNCQFVMLQYIPRNMHTVLALLCFVVVIHWLIFPYPTGLLHWHCGNLTIAPVPAKQPWWIWINTSCEFIMNDCITTTKQSTTKPCAYFLGYTVCCVSSWRRHDME